MRRTLSLLLLGLVLNLLVTWTLALSCPPDAAVVVAGSRTVLPGDGSFVGKPYIQNVHVARGFGQGIVIVHRSTDAEMVEAYARLQREGTDERFRVAAEDVVPEWGRRCLLTPDDGGLRPHLETSFGPRRQDAGARAFGWPYLALRFERGGERWQRRTPGGGMSPPPTIDGGAAIPWLPAWTNDGNLWTRAERVLPWFPVWTGVVVNTVVYACAIAILASALRVVRRSRRRRHGLCVRCAYPVSDSGRCPECGTTVRGAGVE